MATEFEEDLRDTEEPVVEPPRGPWVSGTFVVGVVCAFALLLAGAAWLYHYKQTRIPREFWGFESPRIFREAQTVTAYLIKPEDEGAVDKPQYYDKLYMIGGLRYTVVKKIDVTAKPELADVRARLNDHKNHDIQARSWRQPEWRFGLIFENQDAKSNAHYTASIVFDADCKLGRPQSVDKYASIEPMSAEMLAFFEGIFPESKTMPRTTPMAANSFTQPLQAPQPSGTAAPAGDVTAPTTVPAPVTRPDADVLTLPTGNPSTVSSPVAVPVATGPSIFAQPPVVVSPGVQLPPGLGGGQPPPNMGTPGSPSGSPVGVPPTLQIPSGLIPSSPGSGAGSLDLQQLPRGVTVPPLGGAGS